MVSLILPLALAPPGLVQAWSDQIHCVLSAIQIATGIDRGRDRTEPRRAAAAPLRPLPGALRPLSQLRPAFAPRYALLLGL
eukprot:COSAG06_NODE_5400_length_3504_cov_964.241703_3_plen_81_part_00